jgi:hypothetical protein
MKRAGPTSPGSPQESRKCGARLREKIKILIVKKRIESKAGSGKVCGNQFVVFQAS